MCGFYFSNLMPKHGAQFFAEIPKRVVSGEIRHREHVYDGLANGCEAMVAILNGSNNGKVVVHVADE